MSRILPLVAGALLAGSPAHAAQEDGQAWAALTATANISPKAFVWTDVQLRWTDDASHFGQLVVRPGIGLRLDRTESAMIGYAFARTIVPGRPTSSEHRAWEQVSYQLAGNGKGITLAGRTRIEQRWMEGAPDMGWRLRQQLRLNVPLARKVSAFAWSEVFVSLDSTSWGQAEGLDRWRNAAGLSIPVSKAVSIEPAYINQWVARPGADRVNHIGNLGLSARF